MREVAFEYADRIRIDQMWIAVYLVILSGILGFLTFTVLSMRGASPATADHFGLMFTFLAYAPVAILFGEPALEMALVRLFPGLEGHDE